jgi:hypothetical protein
MFTFFKSEYSISYTRTFQKFADVISYIGGLFGAITAVLLIFKIYCEYSYEMEIGAALFSSDHNLKKKFKRYNMLSFMAHGVLNAAKVFRCKPEWSLINSYFTCRK